MKNLDMDEINKEYDNLVKIGSIKENDQKVHTRIHLMFEKAQNNLKIGRVILDISTNNKIKDILKLRQDDTFFDLVTQASYYAMFHTVNALLATKRIKISRINVHKSALYSFGKHFIINK